MSYTTINICAHDPVLAGRVAAAAAQEGSDRPEAQSWELIWPVSAAADVEAAYASALANDNPNPGGDEAVITDGMILAHVQAAMPPAP